MNSTGGFCAERAPTGKLFMWLRSKTQFPMNMGTFGYMGGYPAILAASADANLIGPRWRNARGRAAGNTLAALFTFEGGLGTRKSSSASGLTRAGNPEGPRRVRHGDCRRI